MAKAGGARRVVARDPPRRARGRSNRTAPASSGITISSTGSCGRRFVERHGSGAFRRRGRRPRRGARAYRRRRQPPRSSRSLITITRSAPGPGAGDRRGWRVRGDVGILRSSGATSTRARPIANTNRLTAYDNGVRPSTSSKVRRAASQCRSRRAGRCRLASSSSISAGLHDRAWSAPARSRRSRSGTRRGRPTAEASDTLPSSGQSDFEVVAGQERWPATELPRPASTATRETGADPALAIQRGTRPPRRPCPGRARARAD